MSIHFLQETNGDHHVWEYVIDDYLDITCGLSPPERQVLIQALKEGRTRSHSIENPVAILINGRLIVIGSVEPRQLWVFDPETDRIRRYRLRASRKENPDQR